jgi:hypothetical protein
MKEWIFSSDDNEDVQAVGKRRVQDRISILMSQFNVVFFLQV